jgi:predicted naringenin-chalcone synthase
MIPFEVLGIGTATPEHFVTQQHAAQLATAFCGEAASATTTKLLPKLYARCGVSKRHSVVLETSSNGDLASQSFYHDAADATDRGPTTAQRMIAFSEHATDLAAKAALHAFDGSGVAPQEVTHLITVSCSGFSAPGVDVQLIERLRLPAATYRTHIGFMGCHGAMNALRVAQSFVASDPAAVVLIVAVELCSLHQQYGVDTERFVANALFADGAAAVVGKRGGKTNVARNEDAGDTQSLRLVATRSTIIPETQDLMGWTVADHGFEMRLSRKVPDVIRQSLRPWLVNWLAELELTIDEIEAWTVHPGGPRILDATFEGLGIDAAAHPESAEVLNEYGNMSSPTTLFILDRQRRRRSVRPCVMLGFGPGLAIEAALFD